MKKDMQIYTLIWDDMFKLESNDNHSQNEIFLYIDEESEYMRLTYPSSTDLITRKKLEGQLRQIQKRGFLIIDKNLRVGQNFEYYMDEDREIQSSNKKIQEIPLTKDNNINDTITKLEKQLIEIKKIWIYKRTSEGTDSMNSVEVGQPEHYITFLASDYQKLNIMINNLPEKIPD